MILLLDVQVLYIVLNGTSRAGESVQPPVSREPEKCPVLHADFPKRKDDAKIELDAGFAPQRDRDPSLEMLTDVAR